MPELWIAAALLAAAAATLMIWRVGKAPPADATAEVYRRHLAEQDELRARGLLDEAEWKAARAEAGRRLLAAADQVEDAPAPSPRSHRLAVGVAAGLAGLAALGIYLATGSPGRPDQPYAERVKAWRAVDPATLDPERVAAVLSAMARERPNDPQVWSYLGRARASAGDAFGAARAFERAVRLNPRAAADWTALGEVLAELNGGRIGADALNAFNQARRLAPDAPEPRYFLGRAEIMAGRTEAGLRMWREAMDLLPADDPRRQAIAREVSRVETMPPASAAEAVAALPAEEQQAAIRAMVEGLAARLEAQPDDAEGWARLIRAYGVLGEVEARERAIAVARRRFSGRREELRLIEDAAR